MGKLKNIVLGKIWAANFEPMPCNLEILLGSPLGSARFRLVRLGSPLGSARFRLGYPWFSSFFWSWFAFLPSDSARLAPAQAEQPKSNANSSLRPHPIPAQAEPPKSNGNSFRAPFIAQIKWKFPFGPSPAASTKRGAISLRAASTNVLNILCSSGSGVWGLGFRVQGSWHPCQCSYRFFSRGSTLAPKGEAWTGYVFLFTFTTSRANFSLRGRCKPQKSLGTCDRVCFLILSNMHTHIYRIHMAKLSNHSNICGSQNPNQQI